MAELILVHDPVKSQGKPRLVFIHGLDGDVQTTWMTNPKDPKTLWPKWLGIDKGCPVWLLGYGAQTSRWKADAMPLQRQATAILDRLSNEPRLLEGPLILIGHSLGGLVIKTLLQHAMSRNTDRHKKVAKNIKGIVFIGTPHFGSWLATLATRFRLIRANPQVKDLCKDEANLETLNQYFIPLLKELDIKTRVFVETQPLRIPIIGRFLPGIPVVSPSSSDAHIPNEVGIPIEENHRSICKLKNRDDDIYRSLLSLVDEIQALSANNESVHQKFKALSSDDFQAEEPGELNSVSVHIAFSTYEVSLKGHSNAPVSTSVCLVTDAPDRMLEQLSSIRQKINRDSLIPAKDKQTVNTATLRELILHPSMQSVILRELAVVSFSAYLYYAMRSDLSKFSTNQSEDKFIVEPLVHRLSKKGEAFIQMHTRLGEIDIYLRTAGANIEAKFRRKVVLPTLGARRYHQLEELASFIAWASAAHLATPKDPQASSIFESLRTRIRFAQNIVTGEKHKRDVNPLP